MLGNKFVIPMDILAATYHAGRDKWDVTAFVMGY
jgi:hypothetical protein